MPSVQYMLTRNGPISLLRPNHYATENERLFPRAANQKIKDPCVAWDRNGKCGQLGILDDNSMGVQTLMLQRRKLSFLPPNWAHWNYSS